MARHVLSYTNLKHVEHFRMFDGFDIITATEELRRFTSHTAHQNVITLRY